MKKAILAVSYGTAYPEAVIKSIQAIEDTYRQTAPDFDVFRAFTGKKIIDILKQKGLYIDTLDDVLQKLADAQYDVVVVQPTHLMFGTEYMKIQRTVAEYQRQFRRIILGEPLLKIQENIEVLCRIIVKKFGSLADCLLLAGHGSESKNSDNLYTDIVRICRTLKYPNVYAAAVESSPTLDDILPMLRQGGYHTVAIVPLMVTAGKHTCRDVTGDGADSWKSKLEREGFCVIPITQGLGEYEEVCALYSEHLKRLCDKEYWENTDF